MKIRLKIRHIQKMKAEKKTKIIERKGSELVGTECNDRECYKHGRLKTHGRFFEGYVKKKFPRRVVIEFERMIYVPKYERYAKSRTKLHARLSRCMESEINIGDYVKIRECRPLSKIIHFTVIDKIKDARSGAGK